MRSGDLYHGKYRGIIIQNGPSDFDGKVKVFVPHVNMTLYEEWNKTVEEEDKFFRYPGQNLESLLTPDILKRLKESLPWADVMMPPFGSSGSGHYWSEKDIGTIDDAPMPEQESPINPEVPTELEETAVGDGLNPPTGGNTTGNSGGFDSTNSAPVGNGSGSHGEAVPTDVYITFYDAGAQDVANSSGIANTLEPVNSDGEIWLTPQEDVNFNVRVYYNRDGSIRSASSSGPVSVDFRSDSLSIRNSSGELLGLNLDSLSFPNARNPSDWARVPRESRTIGTSTDVPNYSSLRTGGTTTGNFRYSSNDTIGIASVDPAVIPYGSIIELYDTSGNPRRFIASDTGPNVVNRTMARINGSNLDVVELFLPVNEWNRTIFSGENRVFIYPYTEKNYSALTPTQRETVFTENAYPNLQLPEGDGTIDSSLFPNGNGEVWLTPKENVNFSVSVYYNRDGSIRSASSSGPVSVDFTSEKLIVRNSATGELMTGVDLDSLSPRFQNAWNPSDWARVPRETRRIGTPINPNAPLPPTNIAYGDSFDFLSNTDQGDRRFSDPSVFRSTPATQLPIRNQSQFSTPSSNGGAPIINDFAKSEDQLVMPPNIAQNGEQQNSISNAFSKDNGNGVNSYDANLMNPQKTGHESGEHNGDPHQTKGQNSRLINPNPLTRSEPGNRPKGIISTGPYPGNHVWVEFEGGDPNFPIVVGTIYTREDHLLNIDADEQLTETDLTSTGSFA